MALERKIGGVIYRFDELTGWDAFDALQKFLKIAGPFVPLIEAAMAEDEGGRTAALVKAIPGIIEKHDGAAMRDFLEMLVQNCKADGSGVVIGVKPQTLSDMISVFALCVEGQFGSFFGGDGLSKLVGLIPKG